jgi:hypothetical protein
VQTAVGRVVRAVEKVVVRAVVRAVAMDATDVGAAVVTAVHPAANARMQTPRVAPSTTRMEAIRNPP